MMCDMQISPVLTYASESWPLKSKEGSSPEILKEIY